MQNYLSDWITKFLTFFFSDKPTEVFNLLDKDDKFTFEKTYKNVLNREDIERIITQIVKTQVREENMSKIWSEYIINHFLFRINKYRENFQKSFLSLKDSFLNFTEIFRSFEHFNNPQTLYMVMKFYMRHLLFSSQLADQELERKKLKPSCIDECGRVLITFFSQFQMSEEKHLVFYCIICLIRIHFKLRTYRNSKTLVGWVEKSGLNFNDLPKAEVVTYFYYSGRLTMYELRLIEARETLLNALNLCKDHHKTNKKLLFEYLIPLNLFFGVVPSEEVLSKYELEDYRGLISSYKNGNVVQFEENIQKLEERLITLGTFLIVEKLKSYVMRNLVRIVYKNYLDEMIKSNKPVIKIELIYNVLVNVVKDTSLNMEELELYLIGVIHKGLISGYVHNNNKVIVFSKKTPFPNLADVFRNNYNKII